MEATPLQRFREWLEENRVAWIISGLALCVASVPLAFFVNFNVVFLVPIVFPMIFALGLEMSRPVFDRAGVDWTLSLLVELALLAPLVTLSFVVWIVALTNRNLTLEAAGPLIVAFGVIPVLGILSAGALILHSRGTIRNYTAYNWGFGYQLVVALLISPFLAEGFDARMSALAGLGLPAGVPMIVLVFFRLFKRYRPPAGLPVLPWTPRMGSPP